MPMLSTAAIAILASLGSAPDQLEWNLATTAQAARTAQASPASEGQAIRTPLTTLVDHVHLLGGRLVRLSPARVNRLLSPTLAEVRDAREDGLYNFRHWRHDRVLVLLPAGARVTEGDRLVLEGWVRTVGGASATGELAAVDEETRRDRRHEVLLVATNVATLDGVSLAGAK